MSFKSTPPVWFVEFQKQMFESIQQLNQKVDNINKCVNKIESDINNIVKPNNLKR